MDKKALNFYEVAGSGKVYQEEKFLLGDSQDASPEILSSFENIKCVSCHFDGGTWSDTSVNQAVFSGTFFEKVTFSRWSGSHIFARLYGFSESHITRMQMDSSDLSTGGFYKVHFENCDFNQVHFAHCEWQDVKFENCRFNNVLFNGSYFDEVQFINCEFQDSEFRDVYGITAEHEDLFKAANVSFSLPFPYSILHRIQMDPRDWYKSRWVFFLCLALIYVLGLMTPSAYSFLRQSFFMDANPILPLVNAYNRQERSFFDKHMFLPNYDFSSGLLHWQFTGSSGEVLPQIAHDGFYSFPSCLRLPENISGQLYYHTEPKPIHHVDVQHDSIWMPVHAADRKLKLSFWYKGGHPRFQVLGRLKNGGNSILNQVETQVTGPDKGWVYFSESVVLTSNVSAVALVLDQFPPLAVYLDDINVEKAI